jgi:hypothetical protein
LNNQAMRRPLLGSSYWMPFVVLQVVEGLRRAGMLEVVGAGNHHQFGVFEGPGDQAGIGNGPHANGHVITFADEIDVAIADVRLNLHRRKTRAKGREQRQDAMVGVGGGNTDAQVPDGTCCWPMTSRWASTS